MAKEQKKDTKQGKKAVRKEQSIVLSKNSDKSVRYKIIKIQQNAVMCKKKKTDTASTAVQSQKKADEKPEDLQKAANISSKSRRRISSSATSLSKPTTSENNSADKYKVVKIQQNAVIRKNESDKKAADISSNGQRNTSSANTSNKTTAPTNTSGDKYRDIAKITAAGKMNEAQNVASAQRATDTNYRVQNQAVVNAINSNETDRHKAKATEINEKLKADVTKARTNTAAVENDMKAFAINKAKETYKVKHLVKKGNVDSERFRNAVNNTIKKEIEQDANYNKYKGEAVLHYKKMICYTNQEHQISKKIKKADNTASQNERLIKTATTVVTLVKDPQRAVANLAEDVIRKSKLGNAALTVAGDIRSFEDASKANSIGDGFSQAMTVLPEKYLKNAVKKTATDVITGRTKAEQLAKKGKKLERKYGHEAVKAQKAERKARYAKESAVRKAKVQFYKEEKGVVKSASAMKNAKRAVKKATDVIGKALLEAGKKALGALIAAIGPEILIVLLIIMVIASLLTWINPHEETLYFAETNTWEPVMVETTDEVLKGYLRHIQDYFDKKQLEILEVVDINFDGFAPDKYDYPYEEGRGDVLDFTDMPKLTTECTKYFIERTVQYYKVDDEDENDLNPSDLEEETIREESRYPLLRKEYYKFDYDLGYEVRTTSTDYDFTRTYTLIALDIESYWNSLNENEGEDEDKNVYSCDNGIFSVKQDITDEVMTLTRDGEIIYSGNVLDYVLSHPEMFKHTVPISLTPEEINDNLISDVTKWFEEDEIEVIKDNQYEFDNYIWNLYEYGNKWIKLSDDCDFESIIALAATKKWQEIEAENFNSETYSFEITDEDLDYCLDSLFKFYYSYSRGRCSGNDCHKYYVGDPPEAHYICDRASSHKHLIGQVTNLELIGGIDMVLNKILKVPQRADYVSDQEYDEAKAKFETDKDIYYVYVEYLKDELGTSTKLSDYENDREAQYRLLRMHQAGHGKKPSNPPTNVTCNAFKRIVSPGHLYYDTAEHYFIDVTWNAPAPEEYAKGKFVEIQGYKVYAYDRTAGTKRLLADVPGTSAHIDYGIGDNGGENSTYDADGTKIWRYFAGPTFTNIIVVAYNNGGSGPASDPVYVAMK